MNFANFSSGILHWYMGSMAKRMFEDEKAAVLKAIDDECNKYAGQALPIPTRGVKARYIIHIRITHTQTTTT